MENRNQNQTDSQNDGQNQWRDVDHQGDWQLAEANDHQSKPELLTQTGNTENSPLYATDGDDKAENDDTTQENDKDSTTDWGNVDPLASPLPDSTDPSGPGSAV